MKRIVLLLALLIAVATSLPAAEPAKSVKSDPTETIRGFYQWYVTALIANRDPMNNRAQLKRFATNRLLTEIARMKKGPDGLDGDYFVDAQDFDNEWASKITVSNVKISGNKATAEVLLKGATAGMNRQLKLDLVLESGAWKVDKVAGVH